MEEITLDDLYKSITIVSIKEHISVWYNKENFKNLFHCDKYLSIAEQKQIVRLAIYKAYHGYDRAIIGPVAKRECAIALEMMADAKIKEKQAKETYNTYLFNDVGITFI